MPDATITSEILGATSVEAQQREASVLAFSVPPATSGSSFSFSISAAGGAALGPITADSNLQVNGNTVTVPSGFSGTGIVMIPLADAFVTTTTFTITRTSASALTGTQTSLEVNKFGWFRVTTLGIGASFNALSLVVTDLPSNEGVQIFVPKPLFLIPSVTGTDYSFTVGNTPKVTSGSVSLSVPTGSPLTVSNNNTTVTATSGLTAGMRSFVTVHYTPINGSPTHTHFAIQRLSTGGTGAASSIQVGHLGHILIPGLPAGVQIQGNDVSYQTTEQGEYDFSFLCEGSVTFSTPAVTFNPPEQEHADFDLVSQTSVTVTTTNTTGQIHSVEFALHTNLGSIDPQIANNPDTDFHHNWKRTS